MEWLVITVIFNDCNTEGNTYRSNLRKVRVTSKGGASGMSAQVLSHIGGSWLPYIFFNNTEKSIEKGSFLFHVAKKKHVKALCENEIIHRNIITKFI